MEYKSPFESYKEYYPIVKFTVQEIVGFGYCYVEDIVQESFIQAEKRFQFLKKENKLEGDSFIGIVLKITVDATKKFIRNNRVNKRQDIEDSFGNPILIADTNNKKERLEDLESAGKMADEVYEYAALLGVDKNELFDEISEHGLNTQNLSLLSKVNTIKRVMETFKSETQNITTVHFKKEKHGHSCSYWVRYRQKGIDKTVTFYDLKEAIKFRNDSVIEGIMDDYKTHGAFKKYYK